LLFLLQPPHSLLAVALLLLLHLLLPFHHSYTAQAILLRRRS
jgi:hypothetical protein